MTYAHGDTSQFGSQDFTGQPNPSFPTVEVSDVPQRKSQYQAMVEPHTDLHSLELSLISNHQMNAIVNKMRSGELDLGGSRDTGNLSNSQRAEKFFQGMTGFSGLMSGSDTNQFGT